MTNDTLTIHPTHDLHRNERSWAAQCRKCGLEASLFVDWVEQPCTPKESA